MRFPFKPKPPFYDEQNLANFIAFANQFDDVAIVKPEDVKRAVQYLKNNDENWDRSLFEYESNQGTCNHDGLTSP